MIKSNSADFYTMAIFSKYIRKFDIYRLNDYKNYKNGLAAKYNHNDNLDNDNDNLDNDNVIDNNNYLNLNLYLDTNFSLIKLTGGITVSIVLAYKFKSILIVPVFFSSYYLIKKCLKLDNKNNSSNSECYFCKCNTIKKRNMEQYNKYYNLIEYVFEKNPNIKNINDFERELDKLL